MCFFYASTILTACTHNQREGELVLVLLKCSQGTYLNHFLCPAVSFSFSNCTTIPGHSVVSTLYLQSMALNCVYSKKCSSKMMAGVSCCFFPSPSSLLHPSVFLKNGSFCFSLLSFALHTFLNVQLSPRCFSAVQLFSSQAKCGHLIMFDVYLCVCVCFSCNHLSAPFGQPYLSDSKSPVH